MQMAEPRQQRSPPILGWGTFVGLLTLSVGLIVRQGAGFVGHVPARPPRATTTAPPPSTATSSLSTSRRLNHRRSATTATGQSVCSAFRASDRPCPGSNALPSTVLHAAASAGDSAVSSSVVDEAPVVVVKRKRGRPRKVQPPPDGTPAAAVVPKKRGRPPNSRSQAAAMTTTTEGEADGGMPAGNTRTRRGRKATSIEVNDYLVSERAAEAQYEAARLAAIARRKEIVAAAAQAAEVWKDKEEEATAVEVPPPPAVWSQRPRSTAMTAGGDLEDEHDNSSPAAQDADHDPSEELLGVAEVRAAVGLPPIGVSSVKFEGNNDNWELSYDIPAGGTMPVQQTAEELLEETAAKLAALDEDMGELQEEEDQDGQAVLDVDGSATSVEGEAGHEISAANATALAAEEEKQDKQQAAIQVGRLIFSVGSRSFGSMLGFFTCFVLHTAVSVHELNLDRIYMPVYSIPA